MTVWNADSGKTTFPVPKGTIIIFHVPGLHYNRMPCLLPFQGTGWFSPKSHIARYWKDPYRFQPERFLGEWPRDAFLPFSSGGFGPLMTRGMRHEFVAGARACLGKRYEQI